MPTVSVIMPTYRQSHFLPRAVHSLLAQSLTDWELLVVDDGSPDDVARALQPFSSDTRVRLLRLPENMGLGAALNTGLNSARSGRIAYLPSDDVYHVDHLATLSAALDDGAAWAHSGVIHHGDEVALNAPPEGLQLVQVMHGARPLRWVTRDEGESDDLDLLFFAALRGTGPGRATGRVTCTWTDHPDQRHKALSERHDGGVNVFRRRYRIRQPLRIRTRDGNAVDERALYRRFRETRMGPARDPLTVLLVGELAYNPERVLALAERGARLFGLWTGDGLGYNTVGPLPFGHVTDIDDGDWRTAVRALSPDVIYAQLDWRAVPFAAEVLHATAGIPFVWHFKEAPQRSIARGEWSQLAALCRHSDAVILGSEEERQWFRLALPDLADAGLVVDASLPKADWQDAPAARRLSASDGAVHTAVLGRPLGLDPKFVGALAAGGVHLHCHGLRDGPAAPWRSWLDEVRAVAPEHLHLHGPVDATQWVSVLSRYDAAWMHRFRSHNGGDLTRATWDDLNVPARLGTFLAAGLPVLQQRSPGSRVAMERLVREKGIGWCYEEADDVVAALHDTAHAEQLRADLWHRRREFTFDHHADDLMALFRRLAGRPTRR
ncbi:glycosyltransferase [Mycolicibacterium grossiae]|uniref:Glycosyltransferase 2-like domain-containing protein n=1 Tax=Mycolicibacterium grossiae TaxID=1552759 RepID=A0A1E8PZC6_9MYCO|nr:hypothetical protein BEL07_25410 [Mycolicibacterium grossiae]QEM45122.1 glycosyltransferase [Mycolicibacterium grossiae]